MVLVRRCSLKRASICPAIDSTLRQSQCRGALIHVSRRRDQVFWQTVEAMASAADHKIRIWSQISENWLCHFIDLSWQSGKVLGRVQSRKTQRFNEEKTKNIDSKRIILVFKPPSVLLSISTRLSSNDMIYISFQSGDRKSFLFKL